MATSNQINTAASGAKETQQAATSGTKEIQQSATGGKTETLRSALERIQRKYVENRNFLMAEDWDWIVVLQCMQDHRLFKANPKRPPLAAFERWLRENKVPQYLSHCSVRNLTYVNNKIAGARYPWTDVRWEPAVLWRWRVLYRTLDKMLREIEDTRSCREMSVQDTTIVAKRRYKTRDVS